MTASGIGATATVAEGAVSAAPESSAGETCAPALGGDEEGTGVAFVDVDAAT
jgi:hypothetical protein